MDVTLGSILLDRVHAHPDKLAFEYIRSDGEPGSLLTYVELLARVQVVAGNLQSRFAPGDRLLLLFPPGLDFIVGFFGCLLAGMVAVPLAPPTRRSAGSLGRVAIDAKISGILGAGPLFHRRRVSGAFDSLPAHIEWIAIDALHPDSSSPWIQPKMAVTDLAVLQYTSGSTRIPQGVALSHLNILSNSELIRRCFGNGPDTIGVSWLPFHHDMGLIGNIIQPVYAGGSCILMAPTTFLHRPQLWLKTISSRRATVSGGPSFAYEQCFSRIRDADLVDLDLSTWKVAYCGAEPIRAKALRDFVHRFQSVGFHTEALLPCYGLAEATLMACCAEKDAPPLIIAFDGNLLSQGEARRALPGARVMELVGCGAADSGQTAIIVDAEQRRQLAAGQLGEIWVKGDGVASGYYRNPDEKMRFHAELPGISGDWLCTGDMGFLYEEQVFVVGRSHDQLVIQGRNLFAHDIEWGLADLDPGLGRCIAFAGERTDQLVVIQELAVRNAPNDYPRLVREIRRRVTTLMGVELHAVAIVPSGSIPLTTSGKPRRLKGREFYLAGKMTWVMHWTSGEGVAVTTVLGASYPNAEEIRGWLIERVSNRLHLAAERVSPSTPFFDYGLTSLDAVELCAELEHWLEKPISPTVVFSHPTIILLSDWLARGGAGELRASRSAPPLSEGVDIAAMTPDALEAWIARLYDNSRV